MTPKEEFIEIYTKYITRNGAEELLEWLKRTDFFYCSCKYEISLCLRGRTCNALCQRV